MKKIFFHSRKLIAFLAVVVALSTPVSQLISTDVALACYVNITKTDSPDPIAVGANTVYTITVQNVGSSDELISLVDTMPAGLDYVVGTSVPAVSTVSGKVLTWNNVTIHPGQSAVFTYQAKGLTVGTWPNTAKVYNWGSEVGSVVEKTTVIEAPKCGDGKVNQSSEQCDSGSTNGTACTPAYGGSCTYCSSECKNVTILGPLCGDAVVNGTEQCDNGFLNGTVCTPEYGNSCSYCGADCKLQTVVGPYCGDKVKNGSEACDGTDGIWNHVLCSATCTTVQQTYCGDGVVQILNDDGQHEQCEGASTEPCKVGEYDGTKVCNPLTCQFNDCKINEYCGNNQLDPGETCDGTAVTLGEHQTCVNCSIVDLTYCGDNKVQAPNSAGQNEQCDNGSSNGTACTPEYGSSCNYCSATCENVPVVAPKCGDKNIDTSYGEVCDNGSDNGVVCKAGYGETCTYCASDCKPVTLTGPKCGDGIQNGEEQCDGTAGISGDQACSDKCTIIYLTRCGNEKIEAGETCDDGNTVNGDGCSSTCQTEVTTGGLSVCKYEDMDAVASTTADRTAVSGWTFAVSAVSTGTEPVVGFITATTTEGGCFTLSGLTPGDYRVSEIMQDGWKALDPESGASTTTVTVGATSTLNFNNYRLGSISGNVYSDADGNVGTTGDQAVLPTWTVTLYTGTTTLSATTTDGVGGYEFPNLMPGIYTVVETLQTSWTQLSHPSDPILILSGTKSTKNNFVNYIPNTPPPPPPPPPGCVGNCGGVILSPVLSVVKKADKPEVKPGEKLIPYEFTVKNYGNNSAYHVKAVDTLPDGFVNASTSQKVSTWDIGTLGIGESKTIYYFVNATSSVVAGVYTNEVVVTYDTGSPVKSTANVTVKTGQVLGEKIVFQNTGFSGGEFGAIIMLALSLIGGTIYYRRKSLSI